MNTIWWIRRDLRLTDNAALHAALEAGTVIPVFILDPALSGSSTRRKSFLYEGLHALDKDLRARGSYLVIRTGRPAQALGQLMWETDAELIFAEEDFTPNSLERDHKVSRYLPLIHMHGQTVQHPNAVLKADRTPYTVYTPYAKAWKAKLLSSLFLYPAPEKIDTPEGIWTEPLPSFNVSPLFPSGEQEALVRLEEFLYRKVFSYGAERNRMDLDGTSALSPYQRYLFGVPYCDHRIHGHREQYGRYDKCYRHRQRERSGDTNIVYANPEKTCRRRSYLYECLF